MARRLPPPLEKEIQAQCLQWLHAHGVFCWRQNAGRLFKEYKGKTSCVRFASVDGISDIIGLLPDGRFLACEVKRPGGKPTADQEAFLYAVRLKGGIGFVAYGVDDLERELRPLLGR